MTRDDLRWVGRELRRVVLLWPVTTYLVLVFWLVDEAARPGQQYANPLLPCMFVGWLAAVIVAASAPLLRRLALVLPSVPSVRQGDRS